jgi:uncharacterized phage protein gp47/JayE
MPDYGVTAAGFVAKTMDVLVEEVETAIKSEFGFAPRGFLKKLVAIICERFTELWELAEFAYGAMDPDAVADALQDALYSITGTIRNEAVATLVTLTCTGDVGTAIPTGSQVENPDTDDTFETLADAEIAALDAWASSTVYAVGDRVTNSSRAYVCITAGESDASGGPVDTLEDETDNDAHWRYIGEGEGAVDVEAECTETGALVVVSGDVSEIVTLVSGWSSVKNLTDGETGRARETNADYRARREEELSQAGATTPDAIRAELLEVDGVTSVTVFYNPTDATDADGVPPHAVEVLVRGGTDQAILDALGEQCIAAGIGTHSSGAGAVTGTWTDSEGTDHAIEFTRPEEIEIYVDVELTKIVNDPANSETYPADGDAQVKAAIVAYGEAQKAGKNVVSSRLIAACFGVSGVLDVTVCDIGLASDPSSSATLSISTRQLAVFDTSRITVVSSNGTP